jgi:hypothetical protein
LERGWGFRKVETSSVAPFENTLDPSMECTLKFISKSCDQNNFQTTEISPSPLNLLISSSTFQPRLLNSLAVRMSGLMGDRLVYI